MTGHDHRATTAHLDLASQHIAMALELIPESLMFVNLRNRLKMAETRVVNASLELSGSADFDATSNGDGVAV